MLPDLAFFSYITVARNFKLDFFPAFSGKRHHFMFPMRTADWYQDQNLTLIYKLQQPNAYVYRTDIFN